MESYPMAGGDGTNNYFPMAGGDGTNSYFHNCSYQKITIDEGKKRLQEAIENNLDDLSINILNSEDSITLNIADFGCSIGPNTFVAMQNIIDAIETKQSKNQLPQAVEFQVLLNDHIGNDFNTLIKNLPYPRRYFAAAVPGSFYSRLFPKSSIHIGHSSNALHWLSRVPREVLDPSSPAWNRNSIYCSGLESDVGRAFLTQFEADMEQFLNARAQELVSRGLMAIFLPGRADGVLNAHTFLGLVIDLLGSSLMDMASMGLTSKEKVETFNIPVYFPSPKELEAIIKRNQGYSIERMEMIHRDANTAVNPAISGLKASVEELIKQHFGIHIVDPLFKHVMDKASNLSCLPPQGDRTQVDIFVFLKRNAF